MRLQKFVQTPPKVLVLDRAGLPVGRPPPTERFPFRHPFRDALADVDAVGHEFDAGGTLQGLQAADDGGHFHAVVRRVPLAAGALEFLAGGEVAEDEGPAAGPGIAAAAAVGEQLHVHVVGRGVLGHGESNYSVKVAAGDRREG